METLSSGVVQIGSHFEAYATAKINGKLIWRDFSGIVRLTMEDAKQDALRMIEDYKAINKLSV